MIVVHVLHQGFALCGFVINLPRNWPKDHLWISLVDARGAHRHEVTCTSCAALVPKDEP
jgi:hypothetical protein